MRYVYVAIALLGPLAYFSIYPPRFHQKLHCYKCAAYAETHHWRWPWDHSFTVDRKYLDLKESEYSHLLIDAGVVHEHGWQIFESTPMGILGNRWGTRKFDPTPALKLESHVELIRQYGINELPQLFEELAAGQDADEWGAIIDTFLGNLAVRLSD